MSPPPPESDVEAARRRAAHAAADEVKSGQVVGLGTGRTAARVVEALAERLGDGRLRDILGVPTSKATQTLAIRLGLPLADEGSGLSPDITIDGADEIDPRLRLVKGGGGALLREKVVAAASARFVVVADWAKRVPRLGTQQALPLEVVPGVAAWVRRRVEALGAEVALRTADGAPYVTDNGLCILDARFEGGIDDPERLAGRLAEIPGLVEHGLFLGMAHLALVGTPSGLERLAPG